MINSVNRYDQMQELFARGKYFKLVCGAGNEDAQEVKRLASIYTLAGASGLDVSASPEIVSACSEGIDFAFKVADEMDIHLDMRPFIKVSVGMPGDHHVRKAYIIDDCVECDLCIPVCPTNAIPSDLIIIRDKCIGCGLCEVACPPKIAAIRYEHNEKDLNLILPECLKAGAENIELHAAVMDNSLIMDEWELVSKNQPNHFVSMCVDRLNLSDENLLHRIENAYEIAGERLLIQADGIPMGGTGDNYNTTVQAVAIADIIQKKLKSQKKYKNLPILLSGGTNSKTAALADMCEIDYCGVAIGTHARGIVQEHIDIFLTNQNFEEDLPNLKSAVKVANSLVNTI
jgi:ferredoxin